MCGIVGYIGDKNAIPILLEGLKRLEYRGYDSAGISYYDGKRLQTVKNEGKLDGLINKIDSKLDTNLGIGHTRWATHGIPSLVNAHPHFDCTHDIVLVHNGIIENYIDIKEKLLKRGHIFVSNTDSEVIVHLIEDYYESDLEFAVKAALNEIRGAYAIAVISRNEPDKIIIARKGSPLIVGIGKGENFIASDVPAILRYTKDVIFLNEGEVGVITKNNIRITTFKNTPIDFKVTTISWNDDMAVKGGYEHFMLKEIMEQPNAIKMTISHYIKDNDIVFEDYNLNNNIIENISRLYIVACGTSYHAGLIGKYWIESIAGITVEVDFASEFRYRNPLIRENDMVLVISQSGETADTLAALRLAKDKTKHTIGVVNVLGSTITREVAHVIYTHAGPEIGVASTKAFTTQLVVLYLMALKFGIQRGYVNKHKLKLILENLKALPQIIETTLEYRKQYENTAEVLSHYRDFLFLGRHFNFPIALEGALKLKEISYLHAEAYPAGEMKHGPIALIDETFPTIAIVTPSHVQEKVLSNIAEIKARKGIIVGIVENNDEKAMDICEHHLVVPEVIPDLSPIVNIIPLQLLAYYIAKAHNCDIDKPRNLAKSVTVE